jgi:hypothetical protein
MKIKYYRTIADPDVIVFNCPIFKEKFYDLPCESCLHLKSVNKKKMEVNCCWEEDAKGMEEARRYLK